MSVRYSAIGCHGIAFPLSILAKMTKARGCKHKFEEDERLPKDSEFCPKCGKKIWIEEIDCYEVLEDIEKVVENLGLDIDTVGHPDLSSNHIGVFIGFIHHIDDYSQDWWIEMANDDISSKIGEIEKQFNLIGKTVKGNFVGLCCG